MFVASHVSAIFLQLMFVYVERDNEDYGKPVADYFGIVGDAPLVSQKTHLCPLFLSV